MLKARSQCSSPGRWWKLWERWGHCHGLKGNCLSIGSQSTETRIRAKKVKALLGFYRIEWLSHLFGSIYITFQEKGRKDPETILTLKKKNYHCCHGSKGTGLGAQAASAASVSGTTLILVRWNITTQCLRDRADIQSTGLGSPPQTGDNVEGQCIEPKRIIFRCKILIKFFLLDFKLLYLEPLSSFWFLPLE